MQQMMQMMQGGGMTGGAAGGGQGGKSCRPDGTVRSLTDFYFPGFNPPTGPRAGVDPRDPPTGPSGGGQTDEFGRALKRSRQD